MREKQFCLSAYTSKSQPKLRRRQKTDGNIKTTSLNKPVQTTHGLYNAFTAPGHTFQLYMHMSYRAQQNLVYCRIAIS